MGNNTVHSTVHALRDFYVDVQYINDLIQYWNISMTVGVDSLKVRESIKLDSEYWILQVLRILFREFLKSLIGRNLPK